jgi:hypothetical protein
MTTMRFPDNFYCSEKDCKNPYFRTTRLDKPVTVDYKLPNPPGLYQKLKYWSYHIDSVAGRIPEERTITSYRSPELGGLF